MNNLVQFLHLCVQNISNFSFKIWEMLEKITTDVDGLLLVLIMKKRISSYFAKIELFVFSKPKVVYLRPFLSSPLFPKF